MHIAQELRKSNIAEYLIYMWQTEDLIRAFQFDIDAIKGQYLSKFSSLSSGQMEKEVEWFTDLIRMMREENVSKTGHLQINKNIIAELSDLHSELVSSEKFPYYRAAYLDALPLIIELRKKNGDSHSNEIETCFNFLYGIVLLRMQGKTISQDTEEGKKTISAYISMLAGLYHKNKQNPLIFE